MSRPFRVAFVPGVTPGKWVRTWALRMPDSPLEVRQVDQTAQRDVLYDGSADMCFVRLPLADEGLHVVPLYLERAVVVVPREHAATAFTELIEADLAGELRHKIGPRLTAKQAVEAVAAGTGVVLLPMSVARLHHRKDVAYVPVGDLPQTQVALAWRRDVDDPRFDEFVAVVRGRTARSSRGQEKPPTQTGKKVPGKKVPGKKVPGKKVPGKKVPGKKVPGKKVPGKKVPGKKVPGKKVPGKKVPGKGFQRGQGGRGGRGRR